MKFKVIVEIDLAGFRQLNKEILEGYPELSKLYSSSELFSEPKDEKELERDAIRRLNEILSYKALTVHQIGKID